jgi:hypothetical protein
LKEALTIEGRWHVHGEEQQSHYGLLICDPVKGLRLEVKEICGNTPHQILASGDRDIWGSHPLVIQGYDSDNHPIRLYGCCRESMETQMGMRFHEFFVQRAVTLSNSSAWADLRSRNFQLRLAMLQSWMDRRIPVREDTSRPADIRIDLQDGRIVTFGAIIHSQTSQSHFEISHDSWLGLEFIDDQPVWRVRSETSKALVLFFTLLTGDPVALDDFTFLPEGISERELGGAEHRLLEQRGFAADAKEHKQPWRMRAAYPLVQNRLADMLRRWFALFENPDMSAVLDLYAAVTYSSLYDTAQFLILAQALEAYHTACSRFSGTAMPEADFSALKERARQGLSREDYSQLRDRFIFANQKTFRTKLEEVITSAPQQARSIIADAPEFANVVKNLRNAYTHHVGGTAQRTRRSHDRSIPQLTRQAHGLLEMLLLAEMGAPDEVYQKIVREHASSISIDLSDPDI